MRIIPKKQPIVSNMTLNGSVLEEQMILQQPSSLRVNCHDAIARKANRILGLMRIRKDIRGWKDMVTFKMFYCTPSLVTFLIKSY